MPDSVHFHFYEGPRTTRRPEASTKLGTITCAVDSAQYRALWESGYCYSLTGGEDSGWNFVDTPGDFELLQSKSTKRPAG